MSTNCNNYKYQQKVCTNLLQKTKFYYSRNLRVKDLNDKKVGGKMKPFFSDKGLASSNIVLKGKGNLISDNYKLANLFKT